MPATGPDLARRFFLGAMFAAGLLADARQEVIDIFADMASSLTEGNAAGFLKPFDRKMQGYEQLDANVRALAEQNDVLTSAEVLENEGSEQARDVKLDWLLQIRSRAESGGLERRRQTVECRLEKRGKHWRITAFEPVALFAPLPAAAGAR